MNKKVPSRRSRSLTGLSGSHRSRARTQSREASIASLSKTSRSVRKRVVFRRIAKVGSIEAELFGENHLLDLFLNQLNTPHVCSRYKTSAPLKLPSLGDVHPEIVNYVRDVGVPILTPIFKLYVGRRPVPSVSPSRSFTQIASKRDHMSLPEFVQLFGDLEIDARRDPTPGSDSRNIRTFLSQVFRSVAVQSSLAYEQNPTKSSLTKEMHMSLRARIVQEYHQDATASPVGVKHGKNPSRSPCKAKAAGNSTTFSPQRRNPRMRRSCSPTGASDGESGPSGLTFDGFCHAICVIAQFTLSTAEKSPSPTQSVSKLIEYLKKAASTHLKMQPDQRAAMLSQIKVERPSPTIQAVSAKSRVQHQIKNRLGVKQTTAIPMGWRRASKYSHNTDVMNEVHELRQKSSAKKHESFERVSAIHGFLSEKNIAQLLQDTNYNRRELYVMYSRFKALCALSETPYGIDRETFKKGVARLSVEDDLFVSRVFALVDDDQSNCIEWPEFLQALSSLEKGSREKKTQFFFRIYDLDRDGFISKDDLSTMFLSSSMLTDDATARDLTDAFVDRVFKQLGAESDKLSLEDVQRYLSTDGINEDVWDVFGRSMLKDFSARRTQ